jgi:hypothetical protein
MITDEDDGGEQLDLIPNPAYDLRVCIQRPSETYLEDIKELRSSGYLWREIAEVMFISMRMLFLIQEGKTKPSKAVQQCLRVGVVFSRDNAEERAAQRAAEKLERHRLKSIQIAEARRGDLEKRADYSKQYYREHRERILEKLAEQRAAARATKL